MGNILRVLASLRARVTSFPLLSCHSFSFLLGVNSLRYILLNIIFIFPSFPPPFSPISYGASSLLSSRRQSLIPILAPNFPHPSSPSFPSSRLAPFPPALANLPLSYDKASDVLPFTLPFCHLHFFTLTLFPSTAFILPATPVPGRLQGGLSTSLVLCRPLWHSFCCIHLPCKRLSTPRAGGKRKDGSDGKNSKAFC